MDNLYKTSDLTEAATLLTYNFPLNDIDRTDPKRVVFLFPLMNVDQIPLKSVLDLYWSKQALIEPNLFMHQVKFIKSRLNKTNEYRQATQRQAE